MAFLSKIFLEQRSLTNSDCIDSKKKNSNGCTGSDLVSADFKFDTVKNFIRESKIHISI